MLYLLKRFGLKALRFEIVGRDSTTIYFQYNGNAYVLYKETLSVYCIIQDNRKLLKGVM